MQIQLHRENKYRCRKGGAVADLSASWKLVQMSTSGAATSPVGSWAFLEMPKKVVVVDLIDFSI